MNFRLLRILSVSALGLLSLLASPVMAQVGGQAPAGAETDGTPSIFAGSMVSLRQQVGATSFVKDALPDYNPSVSTALLIAPRVRLGSRLSLSAMITVTHETTNSDWTTDNRETTLSDTFLTLGAPLWSSKDLGLGLSASAQVRLPTSKPSWQNSMIGSALFGLTGSWSASFAPMGWSQSLSVALIGRWGPFVHRYSDGSLESPWLEGCAELPSGCGRFSHDGSRNPIWRAQGITAITWGFAPKLTLSFQGGVFYDKLSEISGRTSRSGFDVPADPTDPNARGIVFTAFYLNYALHPGVSLALGSETAHLQLQPDSTYRQPFFNQFTTVLLAVRMFPDAIVSALRAGGS